MNIAIVIKHVFDPEAGGVQRVTDSISQIFSSFNHKVIIICYTEEDNYYPNSRIPIFSVKNGNEINKIIKEQKITILINQEGYCLKFTRLLFNNKSADTLVINNLHINPLNFYNNYKEFVGAFLKKHKLGFLNNILVQKIILKYHIFKQRKELNYIIKNTNAFVMLSERFKSELYFLAPSVKKYDRKIHGIGNPFERPQIDIAKLEKENIILFVGRLNILQKRVDLLLKIWYKLHKVLPDWKFWVVGEGEDKAFMENYCKQNHLDRVTFFGKDNPNDYYKRAKIFHMTSAFEGFGNVLVEAQSYGCIPILFNSYAAALDIINHDTNGILIDPFNTEVYVDQTLALINNPQKCNQLALNAYENVNRFSYAETYKKWETVFKSLT